MKKQTIAASLVAGLLVCGLGAAAAPRLMPGDGEFRPLRMFVQGQLGRVLTLRSELDVSDEQREAIKKIVLAHRAEIVTVARPIVEKRRALRDATMAKDPNEEAIRTAANDLGKAIGDAAVLASKVKGEVGKVLTSEQRHKIEAFRQESDRSIDSFIAKFAKQ